MMTTMITASSLAATARIEVVIIPAIARTGIHRIMATRTAATKTVASTKTVTATGVKIMTASTAAMTTMAKVSLTG